jgi:hypothetical protein
VGCAVGSPGAGAGAAQAVATKMMINNNANGINSIFLFINKNSFV